jgi:hypothetical protein
VAQAKVIESRLIWCRIQALPESRAMTQTPQTSDPVRRAAAGERDTPAVLVETQMQIARGLATHGLIAGVAIGLGVPLIVLNFAPSNEWMRWGIVCSAVITGSGIIIASMVVVIIGYLRTSRCLERILERDRSP